MIGVGWPNGPVDNQRILALPGPLLMLSSEHWHVEEAQETHRVLYRVVPPLAQRPAALRWNANAYAAMIIDQVHGLSLTDLVWANELDLNYERGDDEDDFSNLEQRYKRIAEFAFKLEYLLRAMFPDTTLHWPAFTPNKDHRAIDYAYVWQEVASNFDVIDFHAYDSLSNIQTEHALYRGQFPDRKLALTEWHCLGNLEEEQRVIQYLQEQELESYFFIYRWDNASGWWSTTYDIEHNPQRYDMFMNTNAQADPNADKPKWIEFAKTQTYLESVDFSIYQRQIQLESGWEHYREDGRIKTSPSGSKGLGQLNSAFYAEIFWRYPYENLKKSISIMAEYLARFGSYRRALAAYNWGPSNVSGYTKNGLVHPAWDGTREWECPHVDIVSSCRTSQMHHYLDVILGEHWLEPGQQPPQEPTVPEFQFGFKDLADQLGEAVVGKPITDEVNTGEMTYQLTTTGKMEYYRTPNKPYFFRAAQK